MKYMYLEFEEGFRVTIGNERSQAAQMVIPPGDAEGDDQNRHRGADQWLFVVAGSGSARINGKEYPLSPGTLLLIERGDRHAIRNTGSDLLRTLNIYLPPAYSDEGEELAPAK